MSSNSNILNDILSILLPVTCFGCNARLGGGEVILCTTCRHQIPFTSFNFRHLNEVDNRFKGKIDLHKGYALCYFSELGIIQNLLHHLKYKNQEAISTFFGELLWAHVGDELVNLEIDLVIPVPLHPSKKRKRGYNQVDGFGKTIAKNLAIPFMPEVLQKTRNTKTQSKKNRWNRWIDTKALFECQQPQWIVQKNILLVDDIITTGVTLESCIKAIQVHEPKRIYVATMAIAI